MSSLMKANFPSSTCSWSNPSRWTSLVATSGKAFDSVDPETTMGADSRQRFDNVIQTRDCALFDALHEIGPNLPEWRRNSSKMRGDWLMPSVGSTDVDSTTFEMIQTGSEAEERGPEGSSVEGATERERLQRRREQNRRAAVNCRRKKKERAANSVLEYQKVQCSNTELRHQVRQLAETRDKLHRLLESHCHRCAGFISMTSTLSCHASLTTASEA